MDDFQSEHLTALRSLEQTIHHRLQEDIQLRQDTWWELLAQHCTMCVAV